MSKGTDKFVVYIVDDDDSVRHALSRLMRASDIAAEAFATPEDFLQAVTPSSRGCVLLDITMPQMTGLEAQSRMKVMGIHLPVIAVSARESDDVREAARALGASFFLHKPVDGQALLDAIGWLTDTPQDREPTAKRQAGGEHPRVAGE